jgi:hypothetical protein
MNLHRPGCAPGYALDAAVLITFLSLYSAAASGEQIRKSFPTTPNPALLVHNHQGTVQVKGWDPSEIEIKGERPSNAVDVNIVGGEQKVSVQTHPLREGVASEDSRVDFQIRAPRGASVRVDSEQGDITVEDIRGDVTIEGVSGSVVLSQLRGHVSVRTLDGPILIRSSEGYIQAHSINGDLKFIQVNCAELIGSTNSGRIQYEGDFGLGGTYVLNNYSSPIVIMASDKASFDLTARAVEGMIESTIPFRPMPLGNTFTRRLSPGKFLQGRFNTGKSTVQVTSYRGTIQLLGPRSPAGTAP